MKENWQFRILYFWAILFVVCGHAGLNNIGGGVISDLLPIKSFHLGIFAFGAGYFFWKHINDKTFKIIKYKFKKTIIPLYIWTFIYGLVIQVLHNFGYKIGLTLSLKNLLWTPLYSGHAYIFNLGSWFLVPLFMLHSFTALIKPLLKKKNGSIIVFIFYLLLGMLGIELSFSLKREWLLLTRFLYFLPFFGLGLLYKDKLENKDTSSNMLYFSIILIIKFIIIYFSGKAISYSPANMVYFENFYLPYINGFLGIAFWLRVSKILIPLLKNNKLVNIISKNTFAIMMHHMLGFFLLNCFWLFLSLNFKFINGFNVESFSSQMYYMYLPKKLNQFKILYVISGIGISLLIDKIIKLLKGKMKVPKFKFLNKNKPFLKI